MASSSEIKKQSFFKKIIKSTFNLIGYEIVKKNNFFDRKSNHIAEASIDEKKMLNHFRKISLASELNLWSIYKSLIYINDNNLNGDLVECGIYNGSTLSFIGKISDELNISKKIWGYDTFDGFIPDTITKYDTDVKTGKQIVYNKDDIFFSLEQVVKNIKSNDNNFDKYTLIKGDVLKTLDDENNLPEKISFLRLDTDIYATTKKQLEILYPKLVSGGILHIDDYGWCPGVRKAVDEYFKDTKIWLHRIDFTCRLLIK